MHRSYGINPRETGVTLLDLDAVFDRRQPVILEIGSGKGRFLIATAEQHPELNVLGVERSLHYYRLIEARIAKRCLPNARIINEDAAVVVSQMLPEASIREIHIYFPDPWPRARERKRRIIRPAVLENLRRILEPGGMGSYVTDHAEYFEKAVPVVEMFFEIERAGEVRDREPRTNYEAKYLREGRPIHEVIFRRAERQG